MRGVRKSNTRSVRVRPAWVRSRGIALAACPAFEALEVRQLLSTSVWAFPGADGHMLYQPTPLGDHIEDYATTGYMGGTVPIPNVAVPADPRATVAGPSGGDDTAIVQAAIDY